MIIEQAARAQRGPGVGHLTRSQRWLEMYQCARDRGRCGQLWSKLVRTSRGLLDLKAVESRCAIIGRRDLGRRTVPIAQIRGSEGRVADFDRDFNPLQDHTRNRWLGIAKARDRGVGLPPVSLAQVGGVYFVQDGHHRISVAAAFGQRYIDARVVVWEVKGPLPWETEGGKSGAKGRKSGLLGLLRRAPAGV